MNEDRVFEESAAVGPEQVGLRLDRFAALVFPDYSRSFLQRAIRDGEVLLNGDKAKPKTAVREGDDVQARLPILAKDHLEPEPVPLDILFEDEHMLALNKQANLVVHPSRGSAGGTLANGLLHHCHSRLSDVNGPLRPGIVHRLDRDTTGVMLAAKTNKAHAGLAAQFEQRTIRKTYLAVVRGVVAHDQGEVALPIGRDRRMPEKMGVRQLDGKAATSRYEVLERFERATYVRVSPRTGRTHQIRVHLSALGHPVVADAMYGGRSACCAAELRGERAEEGEAPLIERQALHAWTIEFEHPVSRESMKFEAEPPEDFQHLLGALRAIRDAQG